MLSALYSLMLVLPVSAGATPGANPVLTELVETGVQIPGHDPICLPAPSMPDGLDAQGQRAAIAEVGGSRYSADELLRRSVVSPFVLKISTLGESGKEHTARRIDVWFVVYGPYEKLSDKQFLEKQFESGGAPQNADELPTTNGVLTEEELEQRQLSVRTGDGFNEQYAYGTSSLFDRVHLSGTSRVVQTSSSESQLIATLLDPRFADDKAYPNRWWPISRNSQNKLELGSPQPYSGSGGYFKVTRLIEPQGAMFVEAHLVFDEPHGWFDGANLLRSKLPLLVQDSVRNFRRKMARADAED